MQMPDTAAPRETLSAFDTFGRLLVPLVDHAYPDTAARFQDWLAMATADGAVLAPDGRSHLPALIRADAGLSRWARADQGRVRFVDSLVEASRAAGWNGADTPAILAAALARGDTLLLERVLAMPGVPPAAAWSSILVPAIDAEGRPDPRAKPMPAPCAWAAVGSEYRAAPLAWWLDKGLPLPSGILDHASPHTLDRLLAAGALPGDSTAVAWRARCGKRASQPLQEEDVKVMLARLGEVSALSGVNATEARRAPGHALLATLVKKRISSADLARRLQAWQASLPEATPLPDIQAGKVWLFRKVKGPAPWWSHALVGCLGHYGQGRNVVAVFDNWTLAAGPTAKFDAALPEAAQDVLKGLALMGAWLTAPALSTGGFGNEMSNMPAKDQCLAAHRLFLATAAWAGLDEAGAWDCLHRVVAASLSLGHALSDTASTRLSQTLTTTLNALAALGPSAMEGRTLDTAARMLAATPAISLPDRAFTAIHDLVTVPDAPPEQAMRLGLVALARVGDMDKRLINPAVSSSSQILPLEQAVAGMVDMLSQRIATGASIDPASLPDLADAPAVVQSLVQQNALAFTRNAGPPTPSSQRRRRRG